MRLLIKRATLYTPERVLRDYDLFVEDGLIAAVHASTAWGVEAAPDTLVVDAAGLIVTPGWIDLQLNGGFGNDFTDNPNCVWEVAAQLPRFGVTAFLPTIITSPPEKIELALEVIQRGPPPGWKGAIPLGLHLEGPFLNPNKKGAHNAAHLRLPDIEMARNWVPESGVRLVTLAPELPGAFELVQYLRRHGVIVGAGHSMATYNEALVAFEAGVIYGTHLFNAMPPLAHREPGLAGALLVNPEATVGLIADGIHTHPAMVAMAWSCKGSDRITLVTDGMAALGMPPGQYRLGDVEVIVGHNSARLADGTLAGSIATPDIALRNIQRFTGCSLRDALETLTSTPASLLGLNKGRIGVGYDADLTVINRSGEVVMTVVGGEIVYQRLDNSVEWSNEQHFHKQREWDEGGWI